MKVGSAESANLRPLVADRNFIHATRDTGYRNTAAAIAELVDNALQAAAREIRVLVTDQRQSGEHQVTIAVVDDGHGMNSEVLQEALQFGGTRRFDDRTGFGRFGMGLPNSSVSQARRLDVITWQSNRNALRSYLDVDEVAAGSLCGVPVPVHADLPHWLSNDLPQHGTAVVWSRCDRLANRKASTVARNLYQPLGRIFRRALWSGTRLSINDEQIQPFDPLFCHPVSLEGGAEPYGTALKYKVALPSGNGTSEVSIRFTELPVVAWHSLAFDEKRKTGITGGAGVSILRANREIDYGWHLLGTKKRENYDDWWRCEISFQPELDELFGVSHSKQGVAPSGELRAIVGEDLETIARTLNARVRARFESLWATGPSKASETATHRDVLLPALCRKRTSTPADRLSYEVRVKRLDEARIFAWVRRGNVIRLTLNQDHAFFNRIYAPALTEASGRTRYAVEMILLAAARADFMTAADARHRNIDRFILNWSDVLSAFSETL